MDLVRATDPSSGTFDFTFVGDGYTESEQGKMRRDAEKLVTGLVESAPWNKYRDKFNARLIYPLTSKDSGVDNDRGNPENPKVPAQRETALDMGFGCNNIERLLCAGANGDGKKAEQYASRAPKADSIVAFANTDTYGGAGGKVTTVSGSNKDSNGVLQHEEGHSTGDLADEYDDNDPRTTSTHYGGEPTAPSGKTAPNLAKDETGARAKWGHHWNELAPDGSRIGAFEGGGYKDRGIVRPSNNSKMRDINQPFDQVGMEAMEKAIQAKIRN